MSPSYPEYTYNVDCDVTISPAEGYAVKVYLIDLSISEAINCDM